MRILVLVNSIVKSVSIANTPQLNAAIISRTIILRSPKWLVWTPFVATNVIRCIISVPSPFHTLRGQFWIIAAEILAAHRNFDIYCSRQMIRTRFGEIWFTWQLEKCLFRFCRRHFQLQRARRSTNVSATEGEN